MANPKKPQGTKGQAPPDLEGLVAAVDKAAAELVKANPSNLRQARMRLEAVARRISATAEQLDSTRRPSSIFDPANPALIGRFIALTMLAQDRVRLSNTHPFYGAGVYAIYYIGPFAQYRPISRTEHPIYVGKADPSKDTATTAVDQGTKLWNRLDEHRKNIAKANNINLDDFECRFLVVASGWQKAAEDYLIKLFRPIWNSEVGLVFGIGKHGDAAETRGNKRSPWDTLHPGRPWAARTTADQKSIPKIEQELKDHFAALKPYRNLQDIFSRFMADMHQLPSISSTEQKGNA